VAGGGGENDVVVYVYCSGCFFMDMRAWRSWWLGFLVFHELHREEHDVNGDTPDGLLFSG